MKNILVPTDFTKNAEVALNYAMVLARYQNAKITLIHAFELGYANGYDPLLAIADEIKEAKRDSENQLGILTDKIKLAGDIKSDSIFMIDSPVDAVMNTLREKKIDLIVMGTKGAANFAPAIFGSNAAKIIEKANCPVIAVPEAAVFNPVKKITFASALLSSDIFVLNELIKIAEPLNMQVNILHISENAQFNQDERAVFEKFKEEVKRQIKYNKISFQLLHEDNTAEGLDNFLKDGSTGMLAMSTHHHSLFDKLFHSSLSRHMAYHSKVPLLVFHYDKKDPVIVF